MNDRIFLDTNILIYAYSLDQAEKREFIVSTLEHVDIVVISTQVIGEFINVMKKKKAIEDDMLEEAITKISQVFEVVIISLATIKNALVLKKRYQYSYYDSLILAAALENECTMLYSEDMHHNQLIDNKLRIINPFIHLN